MKNINDPPISVVMAVYNGEEYFREAIESILNQTFREFEFIIIDDGSTDKSAEIIKSYNDDRIILIKQENKGLAPALNTGIRIAKGKYIARLDADDISLPMRFEKQLSFLEKNNKCVIVGSNAIIIDQEGKYLYYSKSPLTWDEIKSVLPNNSPFYHSSVMFRKDVCVKCGYYYEKIRQHIEDLILWNKLSHYGELCNLNDFLIKYRLVPDAITNRDNNTNRYLNHMLLNIIKYEQISQNDEIKLKEISKGKKRNWKYSNYYLHIGKIFIENNFNRKLGFKNLLLSISYLPSNYLAWFNLFLLLFPKNMIFKWKRMRGVNL